MQEKWLSMVNKEKIEEYMRYALSSNEMPEHLPDFFWEDWAKAKASNPKFRQLFKDSLKIKQKINFNLPISQKNGEPEFQKMEDLYADILEKIESFFESKECANTNSFGNMAALPAHYLNKISKEKIYLCRSDTFYYLFKDCLFLILYKDNKISAYRAGRYKAFQIQTEKGATVFNRPTAIKYVKKDKELFTFSLREGERANKAFKRLARLVHLPQDIMDLFEQLETARSMLIQTCKMNATLVLSIDPEDFLTASDNSLNWDSCFSLTNSGVYKNGIYSAMVTPSLAIAYIESETPYQPIKEHPEYTFSNKVWRAWVYIDENILFVNKNYPFTSEPITSFLYSWLISSFSDVYVNSKDADLSMHVDYSFMYDDTSYYDLFYIRNESICKCGSDKCYHFTLSESPKCLFCGGTLEGNCDDGQFCCYDCDDVIFCSSCGDRILRDEAYWIDDMPYCSCCYELEIEYKEESKRMEKEGIDN